MLDSFPVRVNNSPMERTNGKIVVVGAGIGGLAAALRLASAGRDVTVIEAQATPGGKMRTLPSPAGPVDAGPTVLTLRAVFDDLFAAAGARLEDHVTLTPLPILARHWWPDGSRLDLHADDAANETAIAAFAGRGAAADYRRFADRSARLFRAFDGPMMQAARPDAAAIAGAVLRDPRLWRSLLPGMTLARDLSLGFRDVRLRQLFGRYATYVGGMPAQAPGVLGLIWTAEAQGVWAVAGGMHALARAVAGLCAARGVRFLYGQPVTRITRQAGRVSGVVLADGTPVPASEVVFNGDPRALSTGLLGQAPRAALPRAATEPRSLSAWVWAFAATPAGADLSYHNVFFAGDPAQEFGPIAAGRMPVDPTLYICAQDRAAGPPDGPERFEIIMNAPPTGPGGQPDPAAGDPETCLSRTFDTLGRFGLRFSPQPDLTALTGPAGFARLHPGSTGSLYGRSPHGLMAAFQRPGAKTRLPGLWLAGGGAHPGAGVPMAALSGRHAAEAIIADRTSASRSVRTAMRGGMSMPSRTTGDGRFRS